MLNQKKFFAGFHVAAFLAIGHVPSSSVDSGSVLHFEEEDQLRDVRDTLVASIKHSNQIRYMLKIVEVS